MALIPGGSDCLAGLSARFLAVFSATGCGTGDGIKALSHGLAAAVVAEITENATVNPTGLFAPPGTAGGPVTGTGTIL